MNGGDHTLTVLVARQNKFMMARASGFSIACRCWRAFHSRTADTADDAALGRVLGLDPQATP